MAERDPLELARDLADALEAADVPYAIGGALAYGYWGPPRGTQDVDLNVFTGPDDPAGVERALDAVTGVGVDLDRDEAWEQIRSGGNVRGFVGRTPVDVFFDSIPLHQSARKRRVERPMLGRPARILSAEDLAVLKLLFFRGKDVVDVERLVGLTGATLDRAYIRRWLVELMGEDDVRVETWDRIVADLEP